MLPLSLAFALQGVFGGQNISLSLHGPVVTFVGPNGSGKSQVMRKLKRELQGKVGATLLLPAGRLEPMEKGRLIKRPSWNLSQHGEPDITLEEQFRGRWYEVETVQGVLNRLTDRKDLEIKVIERLRRLFERNLLLVWERGNLKVRFQRSGSEYSSSKEASGLLHLVALLAALYDDELKAVLFDEPGISLHPQLQAFVLREIERVAGDPEHGGKLIVLATHAAAMIRLRSLQDLPNFVFFSDADTPPVQIDPSDDVLRSRELTSFVRGLGTGHREALFASRPLLVEGPSDEVVVDALDAALNTNLHAAGSHILPVTGVDKMAPAVKLLRLIGKQPAILADLDAVTDNLDLVNALSGIEEGVEAAQQAGHANLYQAVKGARDALVRMLEMHWDSIKARAEAHPYWTADGDEAKRKRRAAAALLLQAGEQEVRAWEGGEEWQAVKARLQAALDLLERAGCFVLRSGTIEDSYVAEGGRANKIDAAYAEAAEITSDPTSAEERHDVVVRALRYVAQVPSIDESAAVAKAFVAVVAPALDELGRNASAGTDELAAAASQHARESAALFNVERVDNAEGPAIQVTLNAEVLDVKGFPIVVRSTDNVNEVARRQIKPRAVSQPRATEERAEVPVEQQAA